MLTHIRHSINKVSNMTVGELIERLKGYDKDLPVCVRDVTVIVEDTSRAESPFDFAIIDPSLHTGHYEKKLLDNLDEHIGRNIEHDGDMYHGTDEVSFNVSTNARITVKSSCADIALVIGELDYVVDDRNGTFTFDEESDESPLHRYHDDVDVPRKYYPECVYIN